MAELNFGLLNPPGSQSIGNAFVTGMGQAQEARARDLQMQQSVRQGQMAELQYKKAQDTETKLNQFYAGVGANGGPKDPVAIEDAMINSGIEQVANTGLAARMTRLGVERDRRLFSEANMPPGAAPGLPPTGMPQPSADGSASNALLGAAPAAPSNALAALVARRDRNIALGTPQGIKNAELIQKDIERETKRYPVGSSLMTGAGAVVGTAPEATSQDIRTMRELGYPPTQAGYIAFRDAQRPDRLLTPTEEEQRIRIALASRPPVQPVAPTITTVEDPTKPGKFLQVDARVYKGGGAGSPGVIGGAKPSATTEKLAAQRKQMGNDLEFAITQLADITKDGGLIDQSTGSGAGRLTDIGAAFFGEATPGAIAIGKIAPIADLALKMVPRFEGPQSNADTKSYKEATGQLADSSLPTKIRKEAGKVVLKIMQARKNQFVTDDMAAEGASASAGNTGGGATGKWGKAVPE